MKKHIYTSTNSMGELDELLNLYSDYYERKNENDPAKTAAHFHIDNLINAIKYMDLDKYYDDDDDEITRIENPNRKKITSIKELKEILNSDDLKTVEIMDGKYLEINRSETYNILEINSDNSAAKLTSAILKKKSGFIVERTSDYKLFAFNIEKISWDELSKHCSDFNHNRSLTMWDIGIYGNKIQLNEKRLKLLFDAYPELKLSYLKQIKQFLTHKEKQKNEIEKEIKQVTGNGSIYELSDEDRLIMEVIEDIGD